MLAVHNNPSSHFLLKPTPLGFCFFHLQTPLCPSHSGLRVEVEASGLAHLMASHQPQTQLYLGLPQVGLEQSTEPGVGWEVRWEDGLGWGALSGSGAADGMLGVLSGSGAADGMLHNCHLECKFQSHTPVKLQGWGQCPLRNFSPGNSVSHPGLLCSSQGLLKKGSRASSRFWALEAFTLCTGFTLSLDF